MADGTITFKLDNIDLSVLKILVTNLDAWFADIGDYGIVSITGDALVLTIPGDRTPKQAIVDAEQSAQRAWSERTAALAERDAAIATRDAALHLNRWVDTLGQSVDDLTTTALRVEELTMVAAATAPAEPAAIPRGEAPFVSLPDAVTCEACGKEYQNRAGLSSHVRAAHQIVPPEPDQPAVAEAPVPADEPDPPTSTVNGWSDSTMFAPVGNRWTS